MKGAKVGTAVVLVVEEREAAHKMRISLWGGCGCVRLVQEYLRKEIGRVIESDTIKLDENALSCGERGVESGRIEWNRDSGDLADRHRDRPANPIPCHDVHSYRRPRLRFLL